jgi:hypothetical protein
MMTSAGFGRAGRWIVAASALGLAACASGEPPTASLGAAGAAVTAAERSGAAERAPVELNSARSKLERAQSASQRGRYEEAARLAREAEVDAQLADSKAQSAAAQTALNEVRQGIETLRGEIQRQTGRPAAQQ